MAIRKTKKDNKKMQQKLQAEVDAAKNQPATPAVPTASVPNVPESNTQKDSTTPNEQKVIVIKDEKGNDRRVGISGDPSAEKMLTGIAIQNSWKSIANAKPGDFWIGSDDQIHIVTEQDIRFAQMKLDELAREEEQKGSNPSTNASIKNTGGSNIPNGTQDPEKLYGGLGEINKDIENLEKNKADPNAPYSGIPAMSPDATVNGYRSIFTDIRDIHRAGKRADEAKAADPVRTGAENKKTELKALMKKSKDYSKTLSKLQKDFNKEVSKTNQAIIDSAITNITKNKEEVDSQIEALKAEVSTEENEGYLEAFSDEQRAKFDELNAKKTELDDNLNYMINTVKGDVDIYTDPNADSTKKQEALNNLVKYVPDIQKNIQSQLAVSSGKLENMQDAIMNSGNKDFIEAFNNIKASVDMFNQQGLDITNPETMQQLGKFVDRLEDIIDHQEDYDYDTRYSNDMKASAINRLLFDTFEDIKTFFVFIAAIESGNPQLIRTSIDNYNDKLQQAEANYRVGQIKGLEENKVRDLTGENIANFFTTSQAKPQLDLLREQLHIQTAEQEAEMIKGLRASFEEYNNYKKANPGKADDFAAWVLNRTGKGDNPLSLLISAGLQNPDMVKSILSSLWSTFTSGNRNPMSPLGQDKTETTNSDKNEKTDIISLGSKGKSSKWIDNALSKANAKKTEKAKETKSEEETPQLDPALMLDMQNTVSQALASRAAPPQAGAPQAGAPKTNNGFGRTNLA